jgi:hypothetical protein
MLQCEKLSICKKEIFRCLMQIDIKKNLLKILEQDPYRVVLAYHMVAPLLDIKGILVKNGRISPYIFVRCKLNKLIKMKATLALCLRSYRACMWGGIAHTYQMPFPGSLSFIQ